MAPCCCSDPEKQSYLSAPEAAQLSARVSGKKKKDRCGRRSPAQPLAGKSVGGSGGGDLQCENKTIRWFQAVAVESRRGRLQSSFRFTVSAVYFSFTHSPRHVISPVYICIFVGHLFLITLLFYLLDEVSRETRQYITKNISNLFFSFVLYPS